MQKQRTGVASKNTNPPVTNKSNINTTSSKALGKTSGSTPNENNNASSTKQQSTSQPSNNNASSTKQQSTSQPSSNNAKTGSKTPNKPDASPAKEGFDSSSAPAISTKQSAEVSSQPSKTTNEAPNPSSSSAPSMMSSANRSNKPPLPQTSNPNEELVFETFYHKNGKTYCCLYTNGMRHYLDSFESGQWLEFPFKWYDEGVLVTDEVQNSTEENATENNTAQTSEADEMLKALRNKADEREGIIKIPGRGTYQTYIFEHRRNIHCYYDPDEGAWIKLPIKWELTTELGKKMVRKVQSVIPQWHDECDIMAAMRASNYNVDDCVNTYHVTLETVSGPSAPEGGLHRQKSVIAENDSYQVMERKLEDAKRRIAVLEEELQSERNEKEYVRKKALEYEEQMATYKANCESAMTHLQEMQKSRPKTAVSHAKSIDWAKELKSVSDKLSETKVGHIQAKSDLEEMKKLFGDFFQRVRVQVMDLTKAGIQGNNQVEEYRTLYRKEVLQRKLLYNQLQEMRGNIRVFCRIRLDTNVGNNSCVRVVSDSDVEITVTGQPKKAFQFDKVFDTNSKQEEVFSEVLPIITSCADGYNVCILAYGQTGSGKTFTMQGPQDNPGVNVRAIKELLKICKEREETVSYTLSLSMLEIYNELIQDLLSAKVDAVELKAQGQKVVLPGLTESIVKSEIDIFNVIKLGESNRKVASTKMNSTSSRSHLMVILSIVGKDKVSEVSSKGTLTLCDLAGSERVGKTEAQGARLTEAAFINKSLSSLGQVFTALRCNQLHIPYRNSKLTHVLQPSLGGDAKACLFVNISPDTYNASETISSLQFGGNAKQVALGQAKKNVDKSAPK